MTERPLGRPGALLLRFVAKLAGAVHRSFVAWLRNRRGGPPYLACVSNRIQRRTTMTLRKIRIALVATILALTATATVPLHSPAQAGISAIPVD
jgi:hypothetical protein